MVAPKEDVEAHLDVVPPRDDPGRDFASHKWPRLEDLDLVALVEELDGRGESRESRADDGDSQFGGVLEEEGCASDWGGGGAREREGREEGKKEREVRKIAATETFRRLRSTFAC